jgi:hypothetical protein
MNLIVVKPFKSFVRGDFITDPTTIREVLQSGNRNFVICVAENTPKKG